MSWRPALAWPAARWIAAAEADPARSQLLFCGLSALLGFAGSWMIAQSLLNVTRALYVRADLDGAQGRGRIGRKKWIPGT